MSSVEFGKRAAELLKEVAFCTPDGLPPFNVSASMLGLHLISAALKTWVITNWCEGPLQDSQVAAVVEEIISHDRLMSEIFRFAPLGVLNSWSHGQANPTTHPPTSLALVRFAGTSMQVRALSMMRRRTLETAGPQLLGSIGTTTPKKDVLCSCTIPASCGTSACC